MMEQSTYSDADELRDLKQSIMQCSTVEDLRAVQITILRIREAERDARPSEDAIHEMHMAGFGA